MKPRIVIGLCSVLIWAPQLLRSYDSAHRSWSVFTLLFILLTCFLFAGKRRAFRIYRFLLWFQLIVLIMVTLIAISGAPGTNNTLRDLTNSESAAETATKTIFWFLFTGAVLYYSDKDHVRAAYHLPPKRKSTGTQAVHDHTL